MSRTWRNHPKESWGEAREMSAREHVYHAARCFRKLSYRTRAKAVRAKRNRERRLGRRFQVYRCPY